MKKIDKIINQHFGIPNYTEHSELEFRAMIESSDYEKMTDIAKIFIGSDRHLLLKTKHDFDDLIYILENSSLEPVQINDISIIGVKFDDIDLFQSNKLIQRIIIDSFNYDVSSWVKLLLDDKLPEYVIDELLIILFSRVLKDVNQEDAIKTLWENREKIKDTVKVKIHECINPYNSNSIIIGSIISGRKYNHKPFYENVDFNQHSKFIILDNSFNKIKRMFGSDKVANHYFGNIMDLDDIESDWKNMFYCIVESPQKFAKQITESKEWFKYIDDKSMVKFLQYAEGMDNVFIDFVEANEAKYPISKIFIDYSYKYRYHSDWETKTIVQIDNYEKLLILSKCDYLFKNNKELDVTDEILGEALCKGDMEIITPLIASLFHTETLVEVLEILTRHKSIVSKILNDLVQQYPKIYNDYLQIISLSQFVDKSQIRIGNVSDGKYFENLDYEELFKYFINFDNSELLLEYIKGNMMTIVRSEKIMNFFEEQFLSKTKIYHDGTVWDYFADTILEECFNTDEKFINYSFETKQKTIVHLVNKMIYDHEYEEDSSWFTYYLVDNPRRIEWILSLLPTNETKTKFVDIATEFNLIELI